MRNVTIRQLQIFSEAAQRLSFARVAERLHLSPAAVPFQIKQLESLTGFALFERVGKKVALTDAGEGLLVYAKIILQALHDADQTFMALRGLTGGKVTIGLVSTAKYVVPHMLARFQASYPAVAINLREENRRQIIATLTKGEIDLAIMGQPPVGADVLAEPFALHPSVLIAAPSHRLAGLTALPSGVLAGELFVVREEGSGTRSLLDRFFQTAGLSPRIAMTSSSNETIKQAVMAGMGLALISRHTIGLELGLGLIATLAVDGFPLMRSWFVAHRRNMPLLPVHSRLWTFLIEQGQSIINDLERSYDEIGIGIREKTANRRIEAGRHGPGKLGRSGRGTKRKRA
jgi:LysR family transcriptional regulator, low CO2-responsive transcriptional regulator